MTEREMLELLHHRYRQSYAGTPRYICAEHVRTLPGVTSRTAAGYRTADFIAVDTWPSSMRGGYLTIHGVEIKVSRADWLRERRDPAKAGEGLRYATHRWLAVPDTAVAHPGELPPGWGLLCPGGRRGLVTRIPAAGTGTEPLTPPATAALLRAAARTAAARAAARPAAGE